MRKTAAFILALVVGFPFCALGNDDYWNTVDYPTFNSVAPEDTYTGNLKKHNLAIAYEYSDYGYREPHMEYPIHDFGKKHGVSLLYTRNSVLSDSVNENDPSFAQLELRYMNGKVDYDGYWSDGTPLYMSDEKDYYWEFAIKIGRYYNLTSAAKLWPYIGFGYRGLRNGEDQYIDLGGGEYGYVYQRTSTYIYIPLGTSISYDIGDSVRLTLNGQFDWLFRGNQNSHTGDMLVNASSVSNKQRKGYGLRASIKLETDLGKIGLFVEPFWRYWKIQNSEKVYLYYMDDEGNPVLDDQGNPIVAGWLMEPFNITREYGIRVGVTF